MLLLVLFVPSCLNAKAAEPQTVTPLADTYVDSSSSTVIHGGEEYLKVSESSSGLSITLLMFSLSEVSHNSNASFEAKLRLRGCSVTSSFVIGVHWYVNNAWDEDTLTSANVSSSYIGQKPESVARVTSENVYYEWNVTEIVGIAIRENFEKVTFVLEAEEEVAGDTFVLFYSKDQQQYPPSECVPQLVFTYHNVSDNASGVSLDMIGKVILGGLASVGVVFVAYKFLKKPAKKRRRFSSLR